MATCPRCKGHLTDSHRCPRRPIVVAAEITLAGIVGAVAGLFTAAVAMPEGRLGVAVGAVVIGAFGGIGLDRYLRG